MSTKQIFLLFAIILTASAGFSQSVSPVLYGKPVFKSFGNFRTKQSPVISPSMLVSPAFYSCNLAFFCRQEIKFEKATGIPFKFRLGSVQQVDYLEGKRGVY